MSSSERELEEQLMEAGNRLVDPPASVEELLPLLDQVENCLLKVEQSPSESMQGALSPSLKALVADKLLSHSNVDVKVAVAACISEITRITAPDAPYDDDQMKEIFQLIVSSFENLSDKSSRSYIKRTSILETVAKVRSCVVMLDLECDELILEMFQHFLKAIRDYHPENVFSSMETIMTLVLEESEDISPELLSPILASVKRNNEEVLPISKKLGKRVLESCAVKLKPYLVEAVQSLGLSLEDYSNVVAAICQENSGSIDPNNTQAASEHMVDNELTEPASPERVDTAIVKSPNSVMSNGNTPTEGCDTLVDSDSLKKQEHGHCTDQSKSSNTSSNAEPDSLETEKLVNAECKPEQTTNRGVRKPPSLMKLTDPSGSSGTGEEKEAEKSPENLKSCGKDIPGSTHDDLPVEAAVASVNEESGIQLTSPKAQEGESVNVDSTSSGGNLPVESHSKKTGRPKKKENLVKEATQSADDVSKKPSKGTTDSKEKPHTYTGKRLPAGVSNEDKSPTTVNVSNRESDTTSDSEEKPLKKLAKKVVASNHNRDGSSMKQLADKKKRGRGKSIPEKDVANSSAKDDDKEMVSSSKFAAKSTKDEPLSQETSKTNSKRKRTPGKEKESGIKDFGEDLVGSKVKVWWPKDQMFYEGVFDSFDPVKKKHKVLYTDGDEEILNLKNERWELIGDGSVSDGGLAADHPSPDASSEMPQKKKVKTISDPATKKGKINASPKRGGGASSSKSKGTKSAHKSREESQVDGKSKDDSKTGSKPEDDDGGKTKGLSSKSGSKSVDVALKSASKSKDVGSDARKSSKSKDDDSSKPQSSTKPKQETPKTAKSKPDTMKIAAKSKGKSPKSGGKSNGNGSGKVKSGSLKVKESEDVNESSDDSEKTLESVRVKLPDSSKSQGSEMKTGKKRRRGAKS